MANIIIPKRRITEINKSDRYLIDWGNPITKNMRACWLLTNQSSGFVTNDLVRGLNLPLVNGANFRASKNTIGLDCRANDRGGFTTSPPTYLQIPDVVTILWRGVRFASPTNNSRIFGMSHNNSDAFPYISYNISTEFTSGDVEFELNRDGIYTAVQSNELKLETEVQYCFTVKSGRQIGYSGSKVIASGTGTYTAIQYSAPALGIGVYRNGVLRNSQTISYLGIIWNRFLSHNEVKEMYNYPYGFLVRPKRRMYFNISAGGGGQDATAAPSLAVVSVLVNTPTASFSSSRTAAPDTISTTVLVNAPTTSVTQTVTANPALASVTVLLGTAVATATSGESAVATPSVAVVSIIVNTAVASTGGITTANPSLAEITILANSPTVSFSRSSTAEPSVVLATIVVNTATGQVMSSRVASPDVASISVVVFTPTAGQVTASGLVIRVFFKSKMEKYVYAKSKMQKYVYDKSRMEKYFYAESPIE